MRLNEKQEQMCSESKWDFSDLQALFLNCTLKKSPELSHTQGLIDISMAIMQRNGVSIECLKPVDYEIANGVWPDMTEYGWEKDDWPQIAQKVMAADILVMGTSIWLGEKTSVCTKVVERLFASGHMLNDLRANRGLFAKPDGSSNGQDVGGHNFLSDLWPVVLLPPKLSHVCPQRGLGS